MPNLRDFAGGSITFQKVNVFARAGSKVRSFGTSLTLRIGWATVAGRLL